MSELVQVSKIEKRIYTIRGMQVMLDRDLAELYGVKPIRLREQVKRNSNRFPENFMFQISEDEVDYMVSQNAIPSRKHLGGTRPYVFTEQGVAGVTDCAVNNRLPRILYNTVTESRTHQALAAMGRKQHLLCWNMVLIFQFLCGNDINGKKIQ